LPTYHGQFVWRFARDLSAMTLVFLLAHPLSSCLASDLTLTPVNAPILYGGRGRPRIHLTNAASTVTQREPKIRDKCDL
jgi:hypothetical protein